MNKKLLFGLAGLALALAACGGSNQAQPTPTAETPPGLPENPQSSVAQCTAQSQELAEFVEDDDHVTGKLEDYTITILEFGDFQ